MSPLAFPLLDLFKLERAVLEVRYPGAYLHWDRAGALWTEMTRKWPDLTNVKGTPVQTVFARPGKHQLAVEMQQARIIEFLPHSSLKSFAESAAWFVDVVVRSLEIHTFTRVGLRQIFFLRSSGSEKAAETVLESGLLKIPDSGFLGMQQRRVLFPEYAVRCEGEATGARVSLKAIQRSFEREPEPMIGETEPWREEQFGVEYDVDYFTTKQADIEQMKLDEWIRGAVHVLRKDTESLVGG